MLYGRPEEEAGLFTGKASRIRDLVVARGRHGAVLAFITLLEALVTALVYGLGGTLVLHGASRSARWWRSSRWSRSCMGR